MIDIETTQHIVQTIAEKYCFLQRTDIERVEKIADFNEYIQASNKLYGQPCVSIHDGSNRIIIHFSSIIINIYKLDDEGDEEYYSIEEERIFSINVSDFANKEALMEAIEEKISSGVMKPVRKVSGKNLLYS